MTRCRHFAVVALALAVSMASAFAHIPRDVLMPHLAPSCLTRIQYHNGASNFVDRVYTLDAHGNTTAMEINAGLLPTVTPLVKRLTQNTADELTAIQTKTNPGAQNWTDKAPLHDDEGNLTSDGDNTYGYDYENRLVSASAASESAFYYYAGDGSRVAAVTVESGSTNTTVFVLDYADPLRRPLAELDGNGELIRRFVWGRGLVAQVETNGTIRYFHADGQGSTLALTDSAGTPTDQWFYSPYGEVMSRTGTTDTPYQWCGGVGLRHEVGSLYFARHRYYHVWLQRWTTRDPIGMGGDQNLYAYAMNAPFLYYDPLGLSTVRIHTDGGVVTLVDPSISEFRSTVGAQPAGSINRLDILGHGSRNQMIIEPGSSGHGLIWVPGVTDQIMFTDNAESFSDLLRDRLSPGATVDLKGCNTAREGPFFDNQHITRQVSIELPGVTAVGSRGFGLGNDLSNPFNRDQYIRFGTENHVFRIPRSYQNGVQK